MHLQRRRSLGEAGTEIFNPYGSTPSLWNGVELGVPGPWSVMGCEPQSTDPKQNAERMLDIPSIEDPLEVCQMAAAMTTTTTTTSITATPLCCDSASCMDLCSVCASSASNMTSTAPSTAPTSPLPTAAFANSRLASNLPEQERPSFLTLPPEIRHQIYQHLPDTLISHRPLIYGITPFSGRKTHCMAAISKQIRQEVMAVFYGQNEWVVSMEYRMMYEVFRRWVLDEVGEGAASLRKLRIGVRCEGLAPKIRRRVDKQPQLALAVVPALTMVVNSNVSIPPVSYTAEDTDMTVSSEGTATDTYDDSETDGDSVDSIEAASTLDESQDSMETDTSDAATDSNSAISFASEFASTSPPSLVSMMELEPEYEIVPSRADGDATFQVDLSERHHGGLVTVLRSEAFPEDTENVRLILESVVGWLWEKRRRGSMTGLDLVEGMDRFLESVGVKYR